MDGAVIYTTPYACVACTDKTLAFFNLKVTTLQNLIIPREKIMILYQWDSKHFSSSSVSRFLQFNLSLPNDIHPF